MCVVSGADRSFCSSVICIGSDEGNSVIWVSSGSVGLGKKMDDNQTCTFIIMIQILVSYSTSDSCEDEEEDETVGAGVGDGLDRSVCSKK